MILTPTRVLVKDEQGSFGVTARVAYEQYSVESDIIFIRKDGWTLGTTKELEDEAYWIWKESWTHFIRNGGPIQPIKEYEACVQN